MAFRWVHQVTSGFGEGSQLLEGMTHMSIVCVVKCKQAANDPRQGFLYPCMRVFLLTRGAKSRGNLARCRKYFVFTPDL